MTKRKYNIDDNYFNEINTERKAYILGLMYADGCVYSNKRDGKWAKLDLKYDDKKLLEDIAIEMKNECPIRRHTYNRNEYFQYQDKNYEFIHDMCRLSFRSDQLVDDLIKLGCPPSKTFKIVFPSSEILPDNLVKHFLRGYLDGDGSISEQVRESKSKYRKTYLHFQITFTGTSSFINSTKEYLNKNVVKLKLLDPQGISVEGIYFGEAEDFVNFIREKDSISVTYYPEINRFRGRESLQIIIQNYC